MNAQEYLTRIQIEQPAPPTLDFLARLQAHHLKTVPFENLDVRAGRPIILEENRLFLKIVGARRGGFCYELNGLFGWLLQTLDFSVTRVAARVYEGGKGQFGPDQDHMALLVHLDQDYLVDVGFGDSFRTPLRLPSGQRKDVSGRYRLAPTADGSNDLELQHQDAAHWMPQYRFSLTPQRLSDFAARCAYNQSSPDSSFTHRLVCTRATAAGRLTLSENSLTITRNGKKQRVPTPTPEDYFGLLEKHFGINLSRSLQPALRDVLIEMQGKARNNHG